MSVTMEEIATLLRAVPTNSPVQEQIPEGLETAVNDVHIPLDKNVHEASQYTYTHNTRRPRAATTMDPIQEEVIRGASMTEVKGILDRLANCNDEAARQEERRNLNNQRAAMTAEFTRHDENSQGPHKLMMGDILRRSESLIANAAQHEHNQDVPACTDDHHNKNCYKSCDSGIDMALMEYYSLRAKGVIPERPYEHWGCDTPEEKDRIKRMEKLQVRWAFQPVNWNAEYTGRGMTKKAMKQPDDIGPMGEIEPSNASPLQMQMHRRRQNPKVLHDCNEEGHQTRRPEFLGGDWVGPFGESSYNQNLGPCNEATPPHGVPSALKTSTQDINALLAKTARAGCELLERQTDSDRGRTTLETHVEDIGRKSQVYNKDYIAERAAGSTNPAVGTVETTYSRRNKRGREPTQNLGHDEFESDGRVPRCKRLRTSGSNTDEVRGSSENGVRQQPHNRPSERIKNLLNTMTKIDTGALEKQQAITYDGRVVKKEPRIDDRAEDINVRPTYAEQDPEEEGNEAEEIVVMDIKSFNPSTVPLVKHSPREWTHEELGLLHLWVQDYGITSWTRIAWCLKHSEHECKTMCSYLIMARNRCAGRELRAGMPEDLLSPAPPASPLPLTSPTITVRSLRPRTRHTVPKSQCGDIVYDAHARSLPKLAPNGTVVDNKGVVVLSWSEEVAWTLRTSQPRRKAGQKLRLTVRPRTEDE